MSAPRQLWLCTNPEKCPCRRCGVVLDYWTHSRDEHPCEHWPLVVDDPRDAPPGAGIVPLDNLSPAAREHVWNLSEQLRAARRADDEPGTWPELEP